MKTLQWLFDFEGRVSRLQYGLAGFFLVLAKWFIDHTLAAHDGAPWPIWIYVLPAADTSVLFPADHPHTTLMLRLWLIAIPFFFAGIGLTLRRLRDAGCRLLWAALFFVPIFNLLMFLWLCCAPTASAEERAWREQQSADEEEEDLRPDAPVAGFVLAVLTGVALVYFSAQYLMQYAWGLFLGVPFVVGFITGWFQNARRVQSSANTSATASLAILLVGACLLGFRFEGLICLAMAIPLALPLAIGGALSARTCLRNRALYRPRNAATCIALLPLLMLWEHAAQPVPPVRPVITSVIVNAPVDSVWRNVIAFPPLAPPKELLFKTGIAYPIGATITGSGPDAIRRCRFSTGDFVEPVTTWEPNHLLAFTVASQPPALEEITLGPTPLKTPHVELHYLRSQHGQFRLVALDAQHTLLEGTTWYQVYFWPQVYWRTWSDGIIHRIHLRVLEHVKANAEREARS